MVGTGDFVMHESFKAKLKAILNAMNTLSIQATTIEGVNGGLQQHQPPTNLEGKTLFVLQQDPLP
jgi:hypothetical protein